MENNEPKIIGQEISYQYVEVLFNFCLDLKEKHPDVILQPAKGRGAYERMKEFREFFEQYHDKARKDFVEGHPYLDSHKLSAIAILTVLKISPLQEWRNDYRSDNYVNETLAILLAHKIMLNVRIQDYRKLNQNFVDAVMYYINSAPFPHSIFDNLTPMHRFRLLLAHLSLSDDNFVNNVRSLAYHCYQFDTFQRVLINYQINSKIA